MDYEFATSPFDHQRTALRRGWDRESFAYFMEMGTGKTKVAIDNAGMLFEEGKIDGVLVIAPKSVYQTWSDREFPAHLPPRVPRTISVWASSLTRSKLQELDKSLQSSDGVMRILCMNVESLSSTRGRSLLLAKKFLEKHRVMLIVDESTAIKNRSAKRTQNVIVLGRLARYRRILTGSPLTRDPLDLYSQFDFLDKGLIGFTSFWPFRGRYTVTQRKNFGGRSVDTVVDFKNQEELYDRISPHMYRVTKDQCLDLPSKTYLKHEVEMTAEQSSAYRSLVEAALIQLDADEYVSATTIITQILKLHQLVCGFCVTEDENIVEMKHQRMDVLHNVLDECPDKVVIWATYRHNIKQIVGSLRRKYGDRAVVEFYGGTPQAEREHNIDRFQADAECRYFVGTPQAGGHGITLTAANTMVYYSNNYDLEMRIQSEDRIHRIGQPNMCTYIDLVCPGTVDEKILTALRKKIDMATSIMGDDYKQWLI